ncbi:hypothetical protein [Rathayibacter sp. SD072]|uniref:hypothetical protein n=1 Tax=Rathayibacter sp. SD072 TaxID=2781731 RepID=UPI0027DA39EE|nr:hypothetical protein [Rathayibacter sp. SD072]
MSAGRALMRAAAASYAANCALGTAVATGAVRTGRWHWIHHALYIATSSLAAAAFVALLRSEPRAAAALAPAALPLAVVPFAGTRGRRHPAIALAAAPFVAAGLVLSRRRSAPSQR